MLNALNLIVLIQQQHYPWRFKVGTKKVDGKSVFTATITEFKTSTDVKLNIGKIKLNLFKLVPKDLKTLLEEKILDKFLQTDMMMKIDKKIVKEVFFKFVDLLQNFDDIDIGVKDFMCCLYNFINFFRKCPQIKNDCFIKLDSIFKNDCFFYYF